VHNIMHNRGARIREVQPVSSPRRAPMQSSRTLPSLPCATTSTYRRFSKVATYRMFSKVQLSKIFGTSPVVFE